jgi:hypothetical protein
VNPSRANYSITVRIDPAGGRLEGSETIRFRNTAARPIGRVAFLFGGDQLRLRGAERVPGVKSPALFELAKSVAPGETAELVVEWAISQPPLKDGEGGATSDWYPRLYWGFGTLDDYEVKAQVPAGFTFAATGKLENGIYRAPGVLACGIFVGKGFQVATQDAGGVAVTAIFTAKGERCARLLLKTAVDAIGYYRGRFGFYPHDSLTIVPGMRIRKAGIRSPPAWYSFTGRSANMKPSRGPYGDGGRDAEAAHERLRFGGPPDVVEDAGVDGDGVMRSGEDGVERRRGVRNDGVIEIADQVLEAEVRGPQGEWGEKINANLYWRHGRGLYVHFAALDPDIRAVAGGPEADGVVGFVNAGGAYKFEMGKMLWQRRHELTQIPTRLTR